MNRIDRLVAMVIRLQGRRVTRAEDLAGHFEISLRTVYRDIAALCEAGVPIVAETGIGYSIQRGYHLPPIMFTTEEASALATAAAALAKSSDPSVRGFMDSALSKIRAALPEEQRGRLEAVENAISFGSESSSAPSRLSLIDAQKAIAERRMLSIVYRSGGRGETTTRLVEPIGLSRYLDNWHLIAWCRLREDLRDFRIDRIQSLEMLSERFAPRPGVDLKTYLETATTFEQPIRIRIQVADHALERAKRGWTTGLISEEPCESGAILTLETGSLDWIVGWLLSFRNAVEILDPPELKTLARAAAQDIINRLDR